MGLDRRTFLQTALGAAVTACVGVPRRLGSLPTTRGASAVAAVRAADHATYRQALREVVARAGGLDFIRPGQRVLLKPATNSGNPYPATTDPETVLVLAELVQERGGLPFVGDRSMIGRETRRSFAATRIADAAGEARMPARYLEDDPAVALRHPQARHWGRRTVPVARTVVEADHWINLCTPRTHVLGDFTMSLKNSVGLVDGRARLPMHVPLGLKERLAEISLVVRPSFIVLDGRQGFVSGGPDGGDLARPGVLLAGRDPVAVDAVGLAHLRLQGAGGAIGQGSIWALPQLARAAALGIGASGAAEIALVGLDAAAEARVREQLG
jgi:uncharacterized protein (DUF362 family)